MKLKSVSNANGSLTLQVPESWEFRSATANSKFSGRIDKGDAVSGGVDVSSPSYSNSRLFLEASTEAAQRLHLDRMTVDQLGQWATNQLRVDDFTVDGCVLESEEALDKAGYVGTTRMYSGCAGLRDSRLWNVYAATETGSVAVVLQLNVNSLPLRSVANDMLTGFAVAEEKVPARARFRSHDLVTP